MTRTTPLRRTTRHISHTRFTDALTFIGSYWFLSRGQKIARGYFAALFERRHLVRYVAGSAAASTGSRPALVLALESHYYQFRPGWQAVNARNRHFFEGGILAA
jgi:hypothetical protein